MNFNELYGFLHPETGLTRLQLKEATKDYDLRHSYFETRNTINGSKKFVELKQYDEYVRQHFDEKMVQYNQSYVDRLYYPATELLLIPFERQQAFVTQSQLQNDVAICPLCGKYFVKAEGKEIDNTIIGDYCFHDYSKVEKDEITKQKHLISNMVKVLSNYQPGTSYGYECLSYFTYESYQKAISDGILATCSQTGNSELKKYMISIEINGVEKLCSSKFVRENYDKCADCGKWHKKSTSIEVKNGTYSTKRVCRNCIDNYVLFESEYYLKSLMTEFEGKYYPENYFSSKIYGYHGYRNGYNPLSVEGETTNCFFGTEVETCGNDVNAVEVLKYPELFHMERDGSIGQGFEIISQPMSLAYIKSRKEDISNMFSGLIARGQKSDETSTCGLHVHVSRDAFKDENAIQRAIAIIDYFKENIEVLARRKSNSYCRYCQIDGVVTKGKARIKSDRYYSVNCTNKKTVEFRVFKGTLNIKTYMATLEFVANVVELANSNAKRIKFSDLTKGDYLPEYVQLRLSKGYTINLEKVIDFTGWNQEEVKKALKEKWDLIKKIQEYNSTHTTQITSRTIFGGAC